MESMTGFGEGRAESESHAFMVTARSVNHRYLDTSVRTPDFLRHLETRLTSLVRDRIDRGRVEIRVDCSSLTQGERQATLDLELLRSYGDAIAAARRAKLVDGGLSAAEMLALPEVISVENQAAEISAEDIEALLRAADVSLDQLVASRQAEGGRLRDALARILDELRVEIEKVESLRQSVQEALANRIEGRIQELLGRVEIDPDRLAMELAILGEKSDIQEELDRLKAHHAAFSSLLEESGPVGKKLEFLCQEILRELNTMASKSRETAAVERVLEGKVACEKLREQVQNIQ